MTFVSIQEHFKHKKTIDNVVRAKFDQFSPYVIPGYRPSSQDSGRPIAGMAQLSRKFLNVRKDRVTNQSYKFTDRQITVDKFFISY